MTPWAADACLLIDAARRVPAAVELIEDVVGSGRPMALPAPARFEVLRGLLHSRLTGERRAALIRAVEAYPVLPLDMESADAAAQIAADLDARGEPLAPQDLLIAGIVVAHGMELVTRNTRHFSRIEGLRLRTY